MPAVEFRDFSFAYQGANKILNNLDLTIPKGSFTVVTGASGAGKTTLCLAVSGVVPHYFGGSVAGEVVVDGRKTLETSMGDLAASVGTVLEDYESQLVTMTVAEEVAFALENRGLAGNEIGERIDQALQWVGLEGLEQRETGALSGGQRQRLAIASVLATRADILVLDEPASALDPEGAEEIYALLADLNQKHGITIIVVEHDLARILPYAGQLVLLAGGQAILKGSCGEVLGHMWQSEEYRDMVPALWQVKYRLEKTLGVKLGEWRRETEAIAELAGCFGELRREECKSA